MLVSRIFDRAVSLVIRAKIAADTDSMVKATTAAANLASKTVKVTETKTENRSETKSESVIGSESESIIDTATSNEVIAECSKNNASTTNSATENITDEASKTFASDGTKSGSGSNNQNTTTSETVSDTSSETRSGSSNEKTTQTGSVDAENTDELFISEIPTSAENVTTTSERLITTIDQENSDTKTVTGSSEDEIERTGSHQASGTSNVSGENSQSEETHSEGEESSASSRDIVSSGESTKTNNFEKDSTTNEESERTTTSSSSNEIDKNASNGIEAEITTVKISETSGVELFPERSEEAKKAYVDSIVSDYIERAPCIIAALVSEAANLDKLYREAHGLPEQPPYDALEISLDSEFPLCDRFASAAVNYTAAMLILDDDVDLYERLFHKWCDAICVIGTEIPSVLHTIVNKYPY